MHENNTLKDFETEHCWLRGFTQEVPNLKISLCLPRFIKGVKNIVPYLFFNRTSFRREEN